MWKRKGRKAVSRNSLMGGMMKRRLICAIIIAVCCTALASAQNIEPAITFGMPFSINYLIDDNGLSVFNTRYYLGFDIQFRIAQSLYIGAEAGAIFGFLKESFEATDFKEIFLDLPVRLVILYRLPAIVLELYTGGIYAGNAPLSNGILYGDDFSFSLNYEIGGRIGFGDTSFFFIEAAKIIGEKEAFRIGFGARLGLL